jgi:hypothetical protein
MRVVRVKVYPRRRPVADVRNGAQRADLGHSGPPKLIVLPPDGDHLHPMSPWWALQLQMTL